MKILVTAGPTREPIDSVRFISNGSSGRMGLAVALEAAKRGHQTTLIHGPICQMLLNQATAAGCQLMPFVTVADLRRVLEAEFASADALVMTAAVGDFQLQAPVEGKISRSSGPITLRLVPTQDVVAVVASAKQPHQRVVTFAVEQGQAEQIQAKAQRELQQKHADMVVVNTPAAMASQQSLACIMSAQGMLVDWAQRPKAELARIIIELISESR